MFDEFLRKHTPYLSVSVRSFQRTQLNTVLDGHSLNTFTIAINKQISVT